MYIIMIILDVNVVNIKPYSAELFCKNHGDQRVF